MSVRGAIRAGAWALVAVGVAAPAVRKRAWVSSRVVLGAAVAAPVGLVVATPRTRARDIALCALNMWAYVVAYELPADNPAALERRARIDYPIAADRMIGLGVPPTVRLQRRFATDGAIGRFERLLVLCHWVWFAVPHCTVGYVLLRRPDRFASAAIRMYAVFDAGAVFYWALPTAPPWYAAQHGRFARFGTDDPVAVRRMMIEFGEQFWGRRWSRLLTLVEGNPLAAMPSLHFATSVMGARLLAETGPIAGTVGWGYASLLGLALVYLGEHYVIDLVGGAVLAESVRRVVPRLAGPVLSLGAWLEGFRG